MKIIQSSEKLQQFIFQLKRQDQKIGFVPTMGFLHEGHLSLMRKAKEENDIVVVSIFVNPLQFGPGEDYDEYPRNEEMDQQRAKENHVDLLFQPSVEEMYADEMSLSLQVTKRNDVLCARSRPTHFDGVVTVLAKLFHLVQPDRVYFGLKDAQQVAVVNGLITDLNFPIELVGLPTIREKTGLAKSSRNVYLREEEKEEALWLYRSLQQGQKQIAQGVKDPQAIIQEVKSTLKWHTSGIIDYVELLSFPALEPVKRVCDLVIIAVAVKFRQARLIDNLLINETGEIVHSIRQGRVLNDVSHDDES